MPGVSHVIAARLLDRFGNVASLAAASPQEWMQVEGMAAKRAVALEAALQAGRTH